MTDRVFPASYGSSGASIFVHDEIIKDELQIVEFFFAPFWDLTGFDGISKGSNCDKIMIWSTKIRKISGAQ